MSSEISPRQNVVPPTAPAPSAERAELMARLRAVVVLAGSVRPTRLRRAAGRFVLELPVDERHTILDCWREQVSDLVAACRLDRLPVRVMIDHATPPASRQHWPEPVDLRIERDPLEYRGTGGLLRDLAADYADDELILVAGSPQLLLEPLTHITDTLASADGDVRLLAQHDGTPGGLMLIRCGAMRCISDVGFTDLKEQALPTIAEHHRVVVARRSGPCGLPVRTMADYLDALRHYHRRQQGQPLQRGVWHEDWEASFSIVETGAQVDPSAIVHDAVILNGAVVESSAVLVRSVVGPGGVVTAGESVTDRLVMPSESTRGSR